MRKVFLSTLLGLLLVASPVWAASNSLTWTDNSNNETNFNIERGTAATVALCSSATFAPLASVGANVTLYTDSAVIEGTTYCYRVNASNSAGISAYSNVAGRLVPFTVPGAPSGLGVVGGP